MQNPLDHFAAPGVIKARDRAIAEAVELAHKQNPQDAREDITAIIRILFGKLNLQGGLITPELLAYHYRNRRKNN